ncbi:MAG: type I secretion system permease/ATPase, partial [Azoarcus sp.]|nr:type I secretion system permease/ATPase [Azoarcus sp.]
MNPGIPASEVRLALGKQKPAFMRAALFSVVIGVLMLAPSFYMLEVYDRVLNSRSVMTLAMLTLLLALVYVVLEVVQWARQGVLREAAEGFDVALGGRVYEAVFLANLHGARAIGQRSLRDFSTVRDFICGAVIAGIMDIPMALLLIGVIFYIDPVLGWFGLASALVQGVITFFNKRSAQAPLAKANTLSSHARAFVESSLKNGEVARAMGMSEGLRQRWLSVQKDLLSHQALASDRAGVFTALSKYVQLVSSSLMLGLGAWLLLGGHFSGSEGLILMASILAGRALAPLVQVIIGWRSVVDAREALARLEELLTRVPAAVPGLPLPAPQGRLTLEHVAARAPGVGATGKLVLRNVSLE